MGRFGNTKSNNNMIILLVVLGILILFGVYCVYNKKGSEEYSQAKPTENMELIQAPDVQPGPQPTDNVQFIPPPDQEQEPEFL